MGDEVFQPKKDVSLLGPGDLGVLVITVGSEGSYSLFVGRLEGRKDIARCNPRLLGTALARAASWSPDSLACRALCGRGDGCRFSVVTGGKYSLC